MEESSSSAASAINACAALSTSWPQRLWTHGSAPFSLSAERLPRSWQWFECTLYASDKSSQLRSRKVMTTTTPEPSLPHMPSITATAHRCSAQASSRTRTRTLQLALSRSSLPHHLRFTYPHRTHPPPTSINTHFRTSHVLFFFAPNVRSCSSARWINATEMKAHAKQAFLLQRRLLQAMASFETRSKP